MMVNQSTNRRTESCQLSSNVRVIKLSRCQSQTNQSHRSSTVDIRSNSVIRTSIGLSSRAGAISNRTESVITRNSIEKTNNKRYSINRIKPDGSALSHSQPHQNQVTNYSEKDNLQGQPKPISQHVKEGENHEEFKKDRITSKTKSVGYQDITHDTIQIDNRSDLRTTDRLSSRMKFPRESREELKKKKKNRKTVVDHCSRCSGLCIFFSILGVILLAAALTAALVSLLNKPSTTTTTTTKLTTAIIMNTANSTIILTTTTMVTTTTTPVSTTTTTDTTTTTETTTDSTTTSTTTTTDTTTTTETTTDSTTTSTTTTTDTTTTTETTTITYVPTGIYALEIPTCATWNSTGITVAGNANGTAGANIASLDTPVSIFVDNNDTLYVCDRDNDRIMKYNVNTTIGIVAAGVSGTPGSSPTQLNQPKGVAVDQMGDIIVADSSNYRIQRFPLGSTVGTTIAINSSSNILGVTRDLHIDVNNAIYVTDSDYSRVVKFYPNNGIGVILAGSSGPGSAADQLLSPFGNFMDGNQTLYIADDGNDRIQKWPDGATSGITVAGVTGLANSSLAYLNKPMAVIVDNNGYIYIADSGNNRIVRWTDNYAAGGTCIVGCTGSTGVAATQLKNPRDLKFDANGNLYVSDQGNNRVQKFMIQLPPNCTYTSG